MKLQTLFETCVSIGMDHDVRGRETLEKQLKKANEEYGALEGIERDLYDMERLKNPYHDTRVLNGDGPEEVKSLFVGIDIDVPQILLADRLRERGQSIDCLFLHHPQGRASLELAQDMRLQVELYRKYGVPEVQIEQQLESTIESVARLEHGSNLFEWIRTAKLLRFPAMCVHTPADNLVYQYMETFISSRSYENVGEIERALLDIPELRFYAEHGVRPLLINCSQQSHTGRIAPTGITGGTDGPEIFVKEQADAGIGTILVMHASDAYKKAAEKYRVNIIQLSHYAADDLGVNLLLDLLQKEDPSLEVFEGCGFKRVHRGADVYDAIRKNARESEERRKKNA
jgi:hypothetical protein